MYDRRINNQILEFGHSGILHKWSFVLYDRQTGSLWVQASGRAEVGPLKGKKLKLIPSTVTTWAQWKAAFPHTRVLPGQRSGYFFGTFHGLEKGRRNIGLVVTVKFKGKLYPYGDLEWEPIFNDRFMGTDLLVVYSAKEGTTVAWNRKVAGRTLTFGSKPVHGENGQFLIRDRQTSTMWDWLTGKAVKGALRGKQLERLGSYPMLNMRFNGFYPDGVVFRSALRLAAEKVWEELSRGE